MDPSTSLREHQTAPLLTKLAQANHAFAARFPGPGTDREPVHTLYGGAHLYRPGAATKLAGLAQAHFANYAPDYQTLAGALEFPGCETLDPGLEGVTGTDAWIARTVFDRVKLKLTSEPIEDHRADFEDGYGSRSDSEEDGHAVAAAKAMAAGFLEGDLPPGVGIRVKALTEEAKHRSLRTLDIFVTTLAAETSGQLPQRFRVTLPKVTSAEQVQVAASCLDALESSNGIAPGAIGLELMLENVQSLFDADGNLGLRRLVDAGGERVTALILGTFDYTATCNVTSTFQAHDHPAADFARQLMLASLVGTRVRLSDGITNIMPIPPHRGSDLSMDQTTENKKSVHAAWKLHFDNIIHSMRLGLYQGWDLNPAQIPVRYAAVYYFYLTGLDDAQKRLKQFIDQAAQASLVGNTFDDAATGQGLVNFFVNGISCGALVEADALATGITLSELQQRSFLKIVENRTVKT